jgi:hypothetical protein
MAEAPDRPLLPLLFFAAATVFAGCGSAAASTDDGDAGASIAPVAEALSPSALTSKEAKTVLRLVDDVCGDTWCDGDYDFGFRRVACSRRTKTCTLTMQIFPRDGAAGTPRDYWRSCKTPGFTGFASLVTTAPNGYQSLDESYYSALTECIARIEQRLPR